MEQTAAVQRGEKKNAKALMDFGSIINQQREESQKVVKYYWNTTPSPLSLSHLAQNPFMCDCHLKWLADYLFDNPIETSGARCSHPRRLANKRISQVKGKKFRCTGRWQIHKHKGGTCNIIINTHINQLKCRRRRTGSAFTPSLSLSLSAVALNYCYFLWYEPRVSLITTQTTLV